MLPKPCPKHVSKKREKYAQFIEPPRKHEPRQDNLSPEHLRETLVSVPMYNIQVTLRASQGVPHSTSQNPIRTIFSSSLIGLRLYIRDFSFQPMTLEVKKSVRCNTIENVGYFGVAAAAAAAFGTTVGLW